MSINTIILAAGKGSRMKSLLPKVLQPLAGRPLLSHVLATASEISEKRLVVIGHGANEIRNVFGQYENIEWIEQVQQLGTAHAVMQAIPHIADDEISIILYGDVPLIKKKTLEQLIKKVGPKSIGLLTAILGNPQGYGRVIRDPAGKITEIIEEKDASDKIKTINEVNTGILAIKTEMLKKLLPKISNDNTQGEYYLTDIIKLAVNEGIAIESLLTSDEIEVQGVNDKKQLATLERAYQKQQSDKLMEEGVTLADPARIDIRGELRVGKDVSIDINCVFEGRVTLGDAVNIGPNCVIGTMGKTVKLADHVEVKGFTIIEEAEIGDGCVIGPYARIRPGTRLAKNAKIGNFVETKKADIGEGSKVNHLTYIGDAVIGKNVNIGAGTITCNYDGINKFQTVIEDSVFIGSNTSLVAPVTVGEGATVGAGSTINKNIDKHDLAIARSKQKNIQGWTRPKKQ